MDKYITNLQELASIVTKQPWNTPLFWTVFVAAFFVLYFAAGLVARLIFGVNNGLLRPFLSQLAVIVVVAAVTAALVTWTNLALAVAAGLAGVLGFGVVWLVKFLIGNKYGPAVGITIFSLVAFAGVAQCGGGLAKAIGDNASSLEQQGKDNFDRAK